MKTSEFGKRKREILSPVLLEAGAAMMDCQSFEYQIALLLYHFSRLGVKGLDPTKVVLILDGQDKRTAGQLIATLKEHVNVSDSIEQALRQALAARNHLMHRVLVDNVERLMDEEGRTSLVKEIRLLRSKVQSAAKKLQPFISGFIEALDGIDEKKFEAEVREKLS